jgi:hypothetical protein
VAAAVACGFLTLAGSASAAGAYAPLNLPGPPLSVPVAQLEASLQCEPSVKDATVTPVLLNPATGVTAAQNYAWNYEPALTKLGIPWCAYTAPNSTLSDIPTSGEYLVYAIRTEYQLAGRKIDIIGHSQGGMSMRWPLRFWPDTRAMVDDVVGFSGSNHGTTVLTPSICQTEGCTAATWQQLYDSPFIDALNSGAETFAGISYTETWTHTDEVVQPNTTASVASAALHTGAGQVTNVAIQQLCPADVHEHLLIGTIDPVAYALTVDALTHPGPANLARTVAANPGLCGEQYMPGVNPADADTYLQVLAGIPGLASVEVGPLAPATTGATVSTTPPGLPCYVTASCAGPAAAQLIITFKRVAHQLDATVLAQEGAQRVPVADATVRIDGKTRTTGALGRAGFTLRHHGRYTLSATRTGTDAARRTVLAG